MDPTSQLEKLEVNEEAGKERLQRQLRVVGSNPELISGPPKIGPIGRSSVLESVKRFLPDLAKAEVDLKKRIESGENVDIEECSGNSTASTNMSKILQVAKFCQKFDGKISPI